MSFTGKHPTLYNNHFEIRTKLWQTNYKCLSSDCRGNLAEGSQRSGVFSRHATGLCLQRACIFACTVHCATRVAYTDSTWSHQVCKHATSPYGLASSDLLTKSRLTRLGHYIVIDHVCIMTQQHWFEESSCKAKVGLLGLRPHGQSLPYLEQGEAWYRQMWYGQYCLCKTYRGHQQSQAVRASERWRIKKIDHGKCLYNHLLASSVTAQKAFETSSASISEHRSLEGH